jgi:hypothetical protein
VTKTPCARCWTHSPHAACSECSLGFAYEVLLTAAVPAVGLANQKRLLSKTEHTHIHAPACWQTALTMHGGCPAMLKDGGAAAERAGQCRRLSKHCQCTECTAQEEQEAQRECRPVHAFIYFYVAVGCARYSPICTWCHRTYTYLIELTILKQKQKYLPFFVSLYICFKTLPLTLTISFCLRQTGGTVVKQAPSLPATMLRPVKQ